MVRRATCGVQLQASAAFIARHTRAGACSLAVSGEEAQHSSFLRARAVARWLWSAQVLNKDTAPARGLSPSARVCGATCHLRPPTSSQRLLYRARRTRTGARCLWGGGAALELPSRARRAALIVGGTCSNVTHCGGERPLFFIARPWCDVPATASNANPAPRVSHRPGVLCSLSLCLWGGGAALELAARVRRAALVVIGLGANQEH